ncbi:MAG: DUF3857 domain-containing protein [Candidatus Tectomicrobia bacterium]|uniref:DUF3857 domain-containing protein n=1 Tax=Tectimicrobiota bacterium TaxID=2528274 RepID=A0A933LQX3_UNCTE|nr:DUF3857 domain-containing protein [Candidatus Tectomicrobia bacterium]
MISGKRILLIAIFSLIWFNFFPAVNGQGLKFAELKPPSAQPGSTPSKPMQTTPPSSPGQQQKPAPVPSPSGKPAQPSPVTPAAPAAPPPAPQEAKTEKAPLLDDSLIRMILSAPSADRYPQAGAVILLREELAQASEGKGLEFTYHVVAKIFNKNGISEFEQVPFPFDSHYQEANLEVARTIQPDGRILETPKEDILIISPPEFSGLNFDPGIKSLVFNLPDLRPESIIEYKIKVMSKRPVMEKKWWDFFSFQWAEPVLKARYTIRVPKQERFLYTFKNIRLTPKVKDEGDWRIYSWEADNLEALALESYMPPAPDVTASLLVSSLESWKEADKWYHALFSSQVVQDEWVKARAMEISKDARSEEEKIRALYYFTQKTIKNVALDLGQGGYGPRPLREVLLNGYGDSEDMGAFLISLLQAAGIKAYPVLLSTLSQGEVDADLPSPGQFNHLIVFIPRAKGNIWLDTTNPVIPFGSLSGEDQDRTAFIVDGTGGKFIRTPSIPFDLNQHITKMKVTVKEDGPASVEETWEEKGIWNEYYRSLYLPLKPDERKERIASYMTDKFPNSQLKEVVFSNLEELETPFKAVIKYEVKALLEQKETLMGTKSDADFLVSEYSWLPPEKLRNDISFKRGFRRIIELFFALPAGYQPLSWTKDVSMEDPSASFKMTSRRQNGEFTIAYDFAVKKNRIKREEYKGFYNFIQDAFQRSQGMVVFETKDKKDQMPKPKAATPETPKSPGAKPGPSAVSSSEIMSSGKELLSKGKYDQALDFFKKALELEPRSGEVHYYLGVVYGYLNQYELADKEFKVARELGYKP